jgi:hypothetical protein
MENIRVHDYREQNLSKIPEKFAGETVTVAFFCRNNIPTLENSPHKTISCFYIKENHLISLQGNLRIVGGNFFITINDLTSLNGNIFAVGQYMLFHSNRLFCIDFLPLVCIKQLLFL